MAKSLDDRITAAMGNGARAATVKELIEELATEIGVTQVSQARQEELAVSPTVSEADAEAAADEADGLKRRVRRLQGKHSALTERLEELMVSERRRQLEADWQAAKDERDALAADLTEYWPQLQGAMVELLQRLAASDDRCRQINQRRAFGLTDLASAEVVARGCTGLYQHPRLLGLPMYSLKEMHLPHFHADDCTASGESAWPPPAGMIGQAA